MAVGLGEMSRRKRGTKLPLYVSTIHYSKCLYQYCLNIIMRPLQRINCWITVTGMLIFSLTRPYPLLLG